MSSWTGKDIVEVVGMAAIVSSLVFVGLQMKQTHEIALASQYQARAEATMNMYLAFLEARDDWDDPRIVRGDLSPISYTRANWAITAFDNHHFQYTAGFLSEDSWKSFVRGYGQLFEDCQFRMVYESRKHLLRSEFVEFVESTFQMCPVSSGQEAEEID